MFCTKNGMNCGGGIGNRMIVQRLYEQKQFQLNSDWRGDKSLLLFFVRIMKGRLLVVKKMTQVEWICSWFPNTIIFSKCTAILFITKNNTHNNKIYFIARIKLFLFILRENVFYYRKGTLRAFKELSMQELTLSLYLHSIHVPQRHYIWTGLQYYLRPLHLWIPMKPDHHKLLYNDQVIKI